MAVLDATNRFRIRAQLIRDFASQVDPTLTKADIDAAIGAIDDFLDTNSGAMNTALPQPFRGAASTAAKQILFAYVLMRRAGLLHVKEDG